MSNSDRCFVGDQYVYEGVEYFAGREKDKNCTGCAFDSNEPRPCAAAPAGCGSHGTIWLTKQNYITNRLMT